ncbi:efflux RND transporter periplasmic adaptor subunit [bacterium]|nr:efflux RND transporter periplasmic adaptor subunit [bacterium]
MEERRPTFHKKRVAIAGVVSALLVAAALVHQTKERTPTPPTAPGKAVVSADGTDINFPAESPALKLFQTQTIQKSNTSLTVVAPARIVASISKQANGSTIHLFDSADLTSLYAQFRQSQALLDRNQKNISRVRDMYANQAATARDLNESENEFLSAKAAMAEVEAKLRASGFNPRGLEKGKAGTVWLLADVPESQLSEVEEGEDVKVALSAFAGQTFPGRAEAVGDVIDPTTRAVQVRVSLPNPNGKILPGMYGRADFGKAKQSMLAVPISALVTVEEQTYVFVAKSDTEFQRVPVVVSTTADQAILLEGVEEGAKIVTSGVLLLKGLSFGF